MTYVDVKKYELAQTSLINLNKLNLYVVDLLLDKDVVDHDKYKWSDRESLNYALDFFEDFKKKTTPKFLLWLDKIHSTQEYQTGFKNYLSILKLIKDLDESDVSNKRSDLLNASYKSLKAWKKGISK